MDDASVVNEAQTLEIEKGNKGKEKKHAASVSRRDLRKDNEREGGRGEEMTYVAEVCEDLPNPFFIQLRITLSILPQEMCEVS